MVQYWGVHDEIISDYWYMGNKYCNYKLGEWLNSEKVYKKIIKHSNCNGGEMYLWQRDVFRDKKLMKISCILVGTIEVLFMKIFFASKDMIFSCADFQ